MNKLTTRKELAVILGCHPKTLAKLLKQLGVATQTKKGSGKRCYLTPAEVDLFKQKVFGNFG